MPISASQEYQKLSSLRWTIETLVMRTTVVNLVHTINHTIVSSSRA